MPLKTIRTQQDVADLVTELGFLPFFNNAMPGYGFSIEELCVQEKWFADDDGPWEWKGPLIRQTGAAYGKFFRGKAGFVSEAWFADFANMRSEGLIFEERYEYGLASQQCRIIVELLEENGPLLTRELRRMGGFGPKKDGGMPGFEGPSPSSRCGATWSRRTSNTPATRTAASTAGAWPAWPLPSRPSPSTCGKLIP